MVNIVRQLDEGQWHEFVDNHSQGTIFHTPEMFQVFACTKGYRPALWAAVGNDGCVLALLLPVQITLLNGWLRHFSTRAVVYGSVLCAPGAEGLEAMARLLRAYNQKVDGRPLFTELRNLSNLEAAQPILLENGFVYEDHLNYLIDLKRPPEVIFQSMGRRTRKNIRRGLRQGNLVIAEANEHEQIAACYNLIRQTYEAARLPLADRSLFEAAFDLLHPKGMVRFTLACVDKTPAAVSIELLYKGVIYGWYGGLDRTYRRYIPNELLIWHIMQWGAENGYTTYDFGGAGKPSENYGVRDFKAKFGGALVNYGRNISVHTPLRLKLSQAGYQLARKFW